MQKQQKHNITLSLSQDLIVELHFFIKKRGISSFVEEAIIEKLESKKSRREEHYMEAAKDEERNKMFAEWDQLPDEGLNKQNEW